jgi:hypothetical protein
MDIAKHDMSHYSDLKKTYIAPQHYTLTESRSLPCADSARQRHEYARHRLCRAHFAQAHGKERPAHFYQVKNFAVRFRKRQHTAQFVAVRNM